MPTETIVALPGFTPGNVKAWQEFLATAPDQILGLDCETTAITDTSMFDPDAKMRLIQFGSLDTAWVLDPHSEWRPLIIEALSSALRFVSHSAYDVLWCRREFGVRLGRRGINTLILANLLVPGPTNPHDLKSLSVRHLDDKLVEAEKRLHARFKELAPVGHRVGTKPGSKLMVWSFNNIPLNDPAYTEYGGLDAIYVRRVLDILGESVHPGMRKLSRREQRIDQLAIDMQWRGHKVDRDYTKKLLDEIDTEWQAADQRLHQVFGFSPRSPRRTEWFEERGIEFAEQTKTGRPSITGGEDGTIAIALRRYNDPLSEEFPVLQDLYTLSINNNVRNNLIILLDNADADGKVHPSINTCQAVTGRMCIPKEHGLLTKRGVVQWWHIEEGDETLDASGNWTPIRAVHHYEDQPIITREHSVAKLESTPEHRWLVSSVERSEPWLEPLGSVRRKVHLSIGEPFDFTTQSLFINSERTQFASLVGLLVSDGRCVESEDGLRAYVYQTEGKFYQEFLRAIPVQALQFDRITNDKTHHELRINARWLRRRLDAAGLVADPLLAASQSVWAWARSLSEDELRAFFTAVWLADGSVAHPKNKKITCQHTSLRKALQYAAYRLGCQSRQTNDGISGWATKDRLGVKFTTNPVWTRHLVESERRGDVWCVTTDSGTFTAWSDRPYLTGNSITKPALQTFKKNDPRLRGCAVADDGWVLVTADYDSQEVRLAYAYSRDKAYGRVINDKLNMHDLTASSIFGDNFSAEQRDVAKVLNFCVQYGGGPKAISAQSGLSHNRARALWQAWRHTYAGLVKWTEKMAELQVVVNPWGRRIPADRWRKYASGNLLIQSSGRDLLGDAMVRLDDAGWGEYLWLPIHDELVLHVPAEFAEAAKEALQIAMYDVVRGVEMTASAKILGTRWNGS